MLNFKKLAVPVLTMSFALCAPSLLAQYGPPQGGPPPGAYGQGPGGWDAPPAEYQQYAQQGFHDGIEGARRDVENHRRPNVNNRDEFRHPNVPGQFRHDYRKGFRNGYDRAMQHLMNGPR